MPIFVFEKQRGGIEGDEEEKDVTTSFLVIFPLSLPLSLSLFLSTYLITHQPVIYVSIHRFFSYLTSPSHPIVLIPSGFN